MDTALGLLYLPVKSTKGGGIKMYKEPVIL